MIWSSSFNYRLILIPKSISFTSDLMQEPWITIADGSFQLKLRRLSLLLAFIKLLLSHLKSSSDDFCNTLTSLLTTLNICFLNNLYFILGSYDNWNWFIMYTGNKNYVKKEIWHQFFLYLPFGCTTATLSHYRGTSLSQ